METAASADGQPCTGVRLQSLTLDPDHTLIIELAGNLGCPCCGRSGSRWVIPVNQDRLIHQADQPGTAE